MSDAYDEYHGPEDDLDYEEDWDDGFGFTEEDCGRWLNGHLTHSCRLLGTEDCDWECPLRKTLFKP